MSQKNTGFVSEIDQFLQFLNKQNPELSDSQRKEKAKFQQLYRLRDGVDAISPATSPKACWADWFNKNE